MKKDGTINVNGFHEMAETSIERIDNLNLKEFGEKVNDEKHGFASGGKGNLNATKKENNYEI